ncbi:23S rRNA (Uracil-5-)-methyltransferase RumA [Sphingomonas antarctica]|uniref:class I SAM-dependent RNA methyltransferase n=1 Tax=Sphingomonas antarctica TaxID=2040274 RepID=UPI0039EC3953
MRIAARGEGVTDDGRHVAFAAPGDEIAEDGTITPGPHHQVPPCRHFPACGGCQLQHVDDAAYRDYLVERVSGALAAQGLSTEIREPHLSPPHTRRRASLRVERRGKQVLLGFNEGKSNTIVDLHECHVLLPELFAMLAPLRGLFATLLDHGQRASVQLTRCDQGIDVTLGLSADSFTASEAIQAFAAEHALARLSIDDGLGPQLRWQPEAVTMTLGGVPVTLPEGAFLQATADGEAALIASATVALAGSVRVADLFAGLGTFALALPTTKFAVEGARDAAAALLATRRMQVAHRDLYRRPMTADELAPFDGVILDPPRAGAVEQIRLLADSTAAHIAYVSCNPATFARDAAILVSGGYQLDWIKPVGQFRWSTHVELVAAFSRA